MPIYILLPLLIAVAYGLVNPGSKNKVPLVKIALPTAVVYVASSVFAPAFTTLMQFVTHLRLPWQ